MHFLMLPHCKRGFLDIGRIISKDLRIETKWSHLSLGLRPLCLSELLWAEGWEEGGYPLPAPSHRGRGRLHRQRVIIFYDLWEHQVGPTELHTIRERRRGEKNLVPLVNPKWDHNSWEICLKKCWPLRFSKDCLFPDPPRWNRRVRAGASGRSLGDWETMESAVQVPSQWVPVGQDRKGRESSTSRGRSQGKWRRDNLCGLSRVKEKTAHNEWMSLWFQLTLGSSFR